MIERTDLPGGAVLLEEKSAVESVLENAPQPLRSKCVVCKKQKRRDVEAIFTVVIDPEQGVGVARLTTANQNFGSFCLPHAHKWARRVMKRARQIHRLPQNVTIKER